MISKIIGKKKTILWIILILVNIVQTEVPVEIFPNDLIRAIGNDLPPLENRVGLL